MNTEGLKYIYDKPITFFEVVFHLIALRKSYCECLLNNMVKDRLMLFGILNIIMVGNIFWIRHMCSTNLSCSKMCLVSTLVLSFNFISNNRDTVYRVCV